MATDPYLRTQLAGKTYQRAARELHNQLGFSATAAIANGVTALGAAATNFMRAFADNLSEDRLRSRRLAVHRELASGAQSAVLRAYRSRTPRRSVGSYRTGQGRISGGVLEATLASPSMIEGTTDRRITFADTAVLSREAVHWRRVNFGALPRSGKKPKAYAIKFNNQTVAVLEFENRPDAFSTIPSGTWRNAGGEVVPPRVGGDDIFTPGRRRFKKTRGIRATQFLDAGNAYLAKETGPALLQMFEKAISTQKGRARAQSATNVRIPVDVRRSRISATGARVPRYS